MRRLTEAILIVNTRSNHGEEQFVAAKDRLCEFGLPTSQAFGLEHVGAVKSKVREAIAGGVRLVIVGGGDGTLNGVANLFVGTKATLGVLPLGTGNQFARDLGIAPTVEAACNVLVDGHVSTVDMGTVGGGYFLNVATVGLSTLIAEGLNEEEKRKLGRVAYAFATARAMLRVRPFRVALTMPEGRCEVDAMQIVIGNGRFHAGPFPVGPKASIEDGKLTAYVVASRNRWGLIHYALSLPGGHQAALSEVHMFTTTEILLETRPMRRITVDGEILYKTPMRFGVAHKALSVMTPVAFT